MKKIKVRTPSGQEITLVEVRDRIGRALGLSYRNHILEDGMLFRFKRPAKPLFHMVGMRFPIDMVFLNHEDEIVFIAYHQRPGRANPFVTPPVFVEKVIEIAAMRSDELGFQIGKKLEFLF